ncbi:hypothetical protein Pmar_PMAR003471 [Perkinsus marinus ATCC 50983]|uniref:Uncharacterized protein n=1 Tax=Perkinsus marinus (strain ATCC 50983 / TXsc) TaxID=423536 RepID=C5KHE6_PERM5|nr:hypothetical protein Pmar_PMAR003471 [Perkinsus marinus ATCC 50983]EER16008.1 hypothetical protein Pmar_PMAR003471 [Perkinsus marinus ATCC 50983]|eukprot:XP_002784212.1 hypothetical protein Pmar_PMAR003471 [Perkinsus marinus ATCC 50983]
MSDITKDLDGPERPHTRSGTAMEAEYFLQESEGLSQGQHEAARLHKEFKERFENGNKAVHEPVSLSKLVPFLWG